MAKTQLVIVRVDAGADCSRLGEVQGRAFDRAKLSGRDQVLIYRCEAAGVQLQDVPENIALSLARQVEIGMLGQIDRSRFVRNGLIIDDPFIFVRKSVGDFCLQISGITFFAILAGPFSPPWIEFGPLFRASVYSFPSSVNFPFAMRFPYRPMMEPK